MPSLQVSLPHFKKPKFLEEAFERYRNFLALKQIYPKEFIVPCYDVDLMWHTHQTHPAAYTTDCMSILGKILPHDDTDADRSEDSKLATSYERTKQLWKANGFGDYPKAGAMYRGKAPDEKGLLPSIATKEFGVVKTITFTLEAAYIGAMSWPEEIDVVVQMNLDTQGSKKYPKLIHEGPWSLGSNSDLNWIDIGLSLIHI